MYSFLQPEIRKFFVVTIILHKIRSVGNITNKACFGQMSRPADDFTPDPPYTKNIQSILYRYIL
jgi:hypothetical protein